MPNIFLCISKIQPGNTETASLTWTIDHRHGSFVQHVVLICYANVPNYFKIFPCVRELQTWHDGCNLNCLCDLDLWDRGVVLSHDTSSWYAKHFCQVIWKSSNAVQSSDTKFGCTDGQMDSVILICPQRTFQWLFLDSFFLDRISSSCA